MRNWLRIQVPVFLAAQALLVHWVRGSERPPAPPDLSSFPGEFGQWKLQGEEPIDAAVRDQLGADQVLSRFYLDRHSGSQASLFVAWFQSQSGGNRQPHSPNVCLPGSGWIPEQTGELTLETRAGPIAVNRYLVVNQGQRAVVLYWYQTPRRVIAGEWEAKLWLVPDALRDRRTDTALARVVVWVASRQDEAATAAATGFARELYPLLRERLPK
jgi:EpsI family protein